MLGGFGHVSEDEMEESRQFIETIRKRRPELKLGTAVGACMFESVCGFACYACSIGFCIGIFPPPRLPLLFRHATLSVSSLCIHADCGGGIGRVCKGVLLPMFTSVDLLEQVRALIYRKRTSH